MWSMVTIGVSIAMLAIVMMLFAALTTAMRDTRIERGMMRYICCAVDIICDESMEEDSINDGGISSRPLGDMVTNLGLRIMSARGATMCHLADAIPRCAALTRRRPMGNNYRRARLALMMTAWRTHHPLSRKPRIASGGIRRRAEMATLTARLTNHPMTAEGEIARCRLRLTPYECHAISALVLRGSIYLDLRRALRAESRNLRLVGVILAEYNNISGIESLLYDIILNDTEENIITAEALKVLLTGNYKLHDETIMLAASRIGCELRRRVLTAVARERGYHEPLRGVCTAEQWWITDIYKYVLK